MGFGGVVEGEDAPSQLEQKVGAGGYNGPERELKGTVSAQLKVSKVTAKTYNRDYLVLNCLCQRYDMEKC